ncbi:MAG TPA: deoxyribodipyrimidine photo-lyase [Alphaproteobacteria bacterium]|nr:deoxyribodipyrimidine photo-lyase [Alphaproteobacteria bacterium]
MKSIVWYRLDLRLSDNPALVAAAKRGGEVVPIFIWSPEEEGDWFPGSASRWWLHQSLAALEKQLREMGSRLIIRRGPSLQTLLAMVTETGATAVFWNRRYEPAVIERDTKVKADLRSHGLEVETFNAALLREPWSVQNQSEKPFRVFTPFWKYCQSLPEPDEPLPAPRYLPVPRKWPISLALAELELEPKIDWARGIRAAWQPGEAGAQSNLTGFLTGAMEAYSSGRNRPDTPGTSRLSPHLHFGEIGPRQIWSGLRRHAVLRNMTSWRSSQFAAELGWREFAHHLLFHFPRTPEEPLRRDFGSFPWRRDEAQLRQWQKGETGFPIVDAGMRELWATGWMHNRVRMITASFLVKDLLLPWQKGARWFWDTLVDADLASNTLGWQWTAGCGADAAPYYRIFNPALQGEKFDPQGDYVRRWCPELSKLPAKWVHQPDRAPVEILRDAKVKLGKNYPYPMVNHALARENALQAFTRVTGVKLHFQPRKP